MLHKVLLQFLYYWWMESTRAVLVKMEGWSTSAQKSAPKMDPFVDTEL